MCSWKPEWENPDVELTDVVLPAENPAAPTFPPAHHRCVDPGANVVEVRHGVPAISKGLFVTEQGLPDLQEDLLRECVGVGLELNRRDEWNQQRRPSLKAVFHRPVRCDTRQARLAHADRPLDGRDLGR